LTVMTLVIDMWVARVTIVVGLTCFVACLVYFTNYKDSPNVANAAVFIFLIECLTPDLETAMFYWYLQLHIFIHYIIKSVRLY
jgi:Ca2+/Na+ antiporter